MAIFGTDDRTTVNAPSGSNANVVAVDTPNTAGTDPGYNAYENLAGSGFAIGSDFFLTAGHVMNGNTNARVTMASGVSSLPARGLDGTQFVPPTSQLNVSRVTPFSVDMAMLQTTSDLATDGSVLGLAVFYDYRDLQGLTMVTAGYPIQNTSGVPTPDATGRTMTQSSSGITGSTEESVHYTADTQGGQSGSGVWLDSSTYSAGGNLETAKAGDLLVGVHVAGGSTQNTAKRISPEIYKTITDAMALAAGSQADAEANRLPINVLVGGGIDGIGPVQSFIPEDNYIDGSYRREYIFGRSGNDRMEGGGANDTLEGGDGVDQALYSGQISEYTITILDATDPDNPTVQIAHTGGSKADGTDKVIDTEYALFEFVDNDGFNDAGYGTDDDNSVMFVPLLADEDDQTKLRDGTVLNISQDVLDDQGDAVGSFSVEIPAFMFDGDVNYTLSLGAQSNILYNFVYIVDSSGSMSGTNIAETRAAYAALTNDLIAQGVAARSQFAVVDFDSFATLYSGLDAQGAINTVNSLPAGGGTNFGPALDRAEAWFESLASVGTATNIAYFLSDGQGSGASANLQLVAEGTANEATVDVRAFGIGSGANLVSLDAIDSGNAVLLLNPSDLTDAFSVSGVDKDTIERIEVKLGGAVVETITRDQLVDGSLGLTYDGTINSLEVTISAENIVTFDVIFNDGTPTATIESKITTGQSELRQASSDGTTEYVALSVVASNYVIQGQSEIVSGNDLANAITVDSGSHTLKGFGGNDTFVINGGTAAIDGGTGIDTVVYSVTRAAAGDLSKTGEVISVGTGDTLVNVEYVKFSDQRVELGTLSVLPVMTLDADTVTIAESDAGTLTADFTLTLSSAAVNDVTVDVATRDGSATAGADYTVLTDTVTFVAGETQKKISVNIADDLLVEGNEAFFVDLTLSGDATFENDLTTASVGVGIIDNDAILEVAFAGDATSVSEGTGGSNTFSVTLRRDGDVSGAAQVNYSVSGITADAADFGGALPSGSAMFAAGQTEATIDLSIATDSEIEPDETFTLNISLASGTGTLAQDSFLLTILNDDEAHSGGGSGGGGGAAADPGSSGRHEDVQPSSSFSEEWYLANNPDVAAAVHQGLFGSGWHHYQLFGQAEGRSYGMPADYGDFSEEYYLARNPDVAMAVERGLIGSGWQHYQLFGLNEGRSTAMPEGYAGFEEDHYLANNPDVAMAVRQGLFFGTGWHHYQLFGLDEGRSYAEPPGYGSFDESFYLGNNPDVGAAVEAGLFGSGWHHYEAFGSQEGRAPAPSDGYQDPTIELAGIAPVGTETALA